MIQLLFGYQTTGNTATGKTTHTHMHTHTRAHTYVHAHTNLINKWLNRPLFQRLYPVVKTISPWTTHPTRTSHTKENSLPNKSLTSPHSNKQDKRGRKEVEVAWWCVMCERCVFNSFITTSHTRNTAGPAMIKGHKIVDRWRYKRRRSYM